MKNTKIIPSELLHSIDVMNTLNGGTSEPILKLEQHEGYREVRCAVPGLMENLLQVEIHNNFLSIYYTQLIHSNDSDIQIPRVVYHKAIPYFIDVTNISANTEDRFLSVRLPYNELANGYHRKVNVEK